MVAGLCFNEANRKIINLSFESRIHISLKPGYFIIGFNTIFHFQDSYNSF